MRFVTWNLNTFTKGRRDDKIRLLAEDPWTIAALQEVDRRTLEVLRESGIADEVIGGLDLTDAPDMKYPHCAALLVRGGMITDPHLINGLPRPERGIGATVTIGDMSLTAVSWHAPNASGDGTPTKMAGYRAINAHLGEATRPVVAGMDNNSSSSVSPPQIAELDADDEWFPQNSFFAADPPHELLDAWVSWLNEHPEEKARALRLRPNGPWEITYTRGGKTSPIVERFDRIMVSPGIGVGDMQHRYGDALAAGSDHAMVAADLVVTAPS